MKRTALLAIPFLLAACGQPPGDSAPVAAAATEDTPNPYAFEVNLTLTPRATEKLVTTNERVIVDAMYFGEPVSEDAPGVDDHGQEVGLGSNEIEVGPENALVKAPGTGFDDTNISSVKGEPQVLVNVYSARKTHADNLLSCGIYQGPVTMAQKQPVDIQCDLILGPDGEPYPVAPN